MSVIHAEHIFKGKPEPMSGTEIAEGILDKVNQGEAMPEAFMAMTLAYLQADFNSRQGEDHEVDES